MTAVLQAQRPKLFLVTLAAVTQVNVDEVHVGSLAGMLVLKC